MSLHGVKLARAESSTGFCILGSHIQFDGGSHATFEHRIQQAWKKFWAHKELFLAVGISFANKASLLDVLIKPSILWGLECGYCTEDNASSVRRVQISMMAACCNLKRRLEESWADWFRRRRRHAAKQLDTLKAEPWDRAVKARQLQWAGHVDRHACYRADSLPLQTLEWLSLDEWRRVQLTLPNWLLAPKSSSGKVQSQAL